MGALAGVGPRSSPTGAMVGPVFSDAVVQPDIPKRVTAAKQAMRKYFMTKLFSKLLIYNGS